MRDGFDREINYLRLSVTDRCNLRCRYCSPEGKSFFDEKDLLTDDEILSAAREASKLGITKVRLTGGEPLVRKNIVSLCERIRSIEGIKTLAITTNAVLLPSFAKDLSKAGVSKINISLDTLDEKDFGKITGCHVLSDVLSGIESALASSFESVKINTVLMKGINDSQIERLCGFVKDRPLQLRFIELMPMAESQSDFSYISCDEVLRRVPDLRPLHTDGVAQVYTKDGSLGTIGLIRPVSQMFCESCNRIRITCDGKIKPCLLSDEEISIKGLDGDEMRQALQRAISQKPLCHEKTIRTNSANRSMRCIGG